MTTDAARNWIVAASLGITAVDFVFFLLAPALGFPLTFDQAVRLLEIVLPVFMGYLGSATHFLFRIPPADAPAEVHPPGGLLGLLVRGPIIVFGLATFAAIFAFGFSNRSMATAGSGMSLDALAGSLSAALGLLSVTTNVAVSYLFSTGE
jgi:hypothetical protein